MSDNRTLKNRPFSNEDALKLRQMTGESMMDCKKALCKAGGDMALAEAYLHTSYRFGVRTGHRFNHSNECKTYEAGSQSVVS